eukprot:2754406-Amphidinium_carterae.1
MRVADSVVMELRCARTLRRGVRHLQRAAASRRVGTDPVSSLLTHTPWVLGLVMVGGFPHS